MAASRADFDELDAELRALLAGSRLSETDVRAVTHYLDHSEFELALDELVCVLNLGQRPIASDARARIDKLVKRMGLAGAHFDELRP